MKNSIAKIVVDPLFKLKKVEKIREEFSAVKALKAKVLYERLNKPDFGEEDPYKKLLGRKRTWEVACQTVDKAEIIDKGFQDIEREEKRSVNLKNGRESSYSDIRSTKRSNLNSNR